MSMPGFSAEATLYKTAINYAGAARCSPSIWPVAPQQLLAHKIRMTTSLRAVSESGRWCSPITWGVSPPSAEHDMVVFTCWQTCCDTIRLRDPRTGKEVDFIIVNSCRQEFCGAFQAEIGAGELVPI